MPQLIVMLTYNDLTVDNAEEIFEKCRHSDAVWWGFKEKPLPADRMKALFQRMKAAGKTTFLEVVAYDEKSGLDGARLAADCGCDVLMGTRFFDSISSFCKSYGIKYMPFVGTIEGRPSVLKGNIDDIVEEARSVVERGADGIDLLGYRYDGDAVELIKRVVTAIPAPVCVAGSIDSYSRLDEIKDASPWAFTIGSAFFDGKFGDTFPAQIDNVNSYLAATKS